MDTDYEILINVTSEYAYLCRLLTSLDLKLSQDLFYSVCVGNFVKVYTAQSFLLNRIHYANLSQIDVRKH